MKPNDWRARLMQPGHEFAQMPFWFWNDELSDAETRRQLAAFREKGIYGVIIHARMGLPKSIPYMGKVWLERVRFAVEEAARTGMYVCLYDEGMYPSGSAHGEVVKSNADFAAQGLACHAKDVTGPTEVRVAAPRKGKFVAAVVARQTEKKDVLDLDGAVVVTEPGRAAKLGEGKWRVMTFVMEPTGGHIRGVHYGEEDGEPGAPAAADLLSFEAMQAFIRFCHEPYHETLKGHFGKTVFAIFTDEPSLSGRGGRSGLRPWTAGLAADFKKRRGYALAPLLPALFFDVGERTRKVRDDFDLTVAERLDETYYQQLSRWCAGHGIALTGHPAHSDEIRPLRLFQIPGQDMVWRWVLPGKNAIDGENSTVGKCSSSVARHDGRRRNANEIYGAYGWHLTMDEMKWLADWLIVRGVNLLYPHAVYYTIRDKRAYERPPDLGIHNSWWPRYRVFADYTARLCGLMADCEQVCEVAVLSVNNTLPWRAAKWLFQHQVDFNYLEDWRLVEQAKIEGGRIRIGAMAYTTLIVDQDRPLTGETAKGVQAFKDAGGVVHTCQGEPSAKLVAGLGRDVVVEPPSVDVRAAHVVKDKMHFYLFVNEGEGPIDATVTVRCFGTAQWYDAWSDKFTGAPVEPRGKDRLATPLRLGRRESVILCVDPARPPLMASACYAPRGEPTVTEIGGAWKVTDGEGKQVLDKLGDWRDVPELKQFAGTLTYATTFEAKRQAGRKVELDLGKVGDWAVVRLNSKDLGPRFWAPYVVDVSEAIRDGKNELEVEVTNSFSNKYVPKDARAAGLMGPVRLRCY
ncbi:MAG: hypothetical protein JXQ73_21395 [Phycisphaerae bacterium]|nr:hypothetical protein [Phycisphaerae bacterium]